MIIDQRNHYICHLRAFSITCDHMWLQFGILDILEVTPQKHGWRKSVFGCKLVVFCWNSVIVDFLFVRIHSELWLRFFKFSFNTALMKKFSSKYLVVLIPMRVKAIFTIYFVYKFLGCTAEGSIKHKYTDTKQNQSTKLNVKLYIEPQKQSKCKQKVQLNSCN